MLSKIKFTEINTKILSLKNSWSFKGICIALAIGFISLGVIGGCNNNGGDGGTRRTLHGVHLGDHREDALQDLMDGMDIGPHIGEPHNIILDGISVENLTEDEKALIREAFDAGFIILAYEMKEADTCFLYSDVLQHPLVCDDIEALPEGDMQEVFTIEDHDSVTWTSAGHFSVTDPLDEVEGTEVVPMSQDSQFSQIRQDEALDALGFAFHAVQMREWIESHETRKAQFVLMSLNEEEIANMIRVADVGGTITNLAEAWIQTSQVRVGVNKSTGMIDSSITDPSSTDVYQITSQAWVATEETPTGTSSFLYVNQDLLLQSLNGYVRSGDTQKAWYLSKLTTINTLKVGGSVLDVSDATLINNQPSTNQASTVSTTVSMSASLTGTVGVDSNGASASVSGGVSWSTSNTYQKAAVAIQNISLSNGNDASWTYIPNGSELDTDGCNDSVTNPADLSRTTFTP